MPMDPVNEPNRVTDPNSPVREERAMRRPSHSRPDRPCASRAGGTGRWFHVGVLWQSERGAVSARLARISSVSRGSITAGVLALPWRDLAFDGGIAKGFQEQVVRPIRDLAAGRSMPNRSSEHLPAREHRRKGGGRLTIGIYFTGHASGPARHTPLRHQRHERAVGCPVAIVEAVHARTTRSEESNRPTLPLAVAVAASSAFPPVLSPVELDLEEGMYRSQRAIICVREPYTTTWCSPTRGSTTTWGSKRSGNATRLCS